MTKEEEEMRIEEENFRERISEVIVTRTPTAEDLERYRKRLEEHRKRFLR